MIQPQELRIGNYISDLDGNIIKVEELTICASYTTKKRINNLPFDYYKPIPLTEEILLRFGFEKEFKDFEMSDEVFAFVKSQIYIHFIDGECWLCEEYDSNLSKIRKLKGVYDLQNLHFALTGEELTFK